MNNLKINEKISDFFYLQWLRPENVPWDLHVCKIFQRYFINNKFYKSLEIGVGNGLNTFINLDGKINKSFDFFLNSKVDNFFKFDDIYDYKLKLENNFYNKIIKKKTDNKFNLVVDYKKNLINISKLLNISKNYMVFDCNNSFKKFEKFDLIYSSIVYWLNNPFDSIIRIMKLLNCNGHFLFTIPNQNYLKYCKSYTLKGKMWNLINRGRKKTLKCTVDENSFEKWLKKNKINIVAKHYLLSEKTLKIWDIGLRPFSPFLIKMANNMSYDERLSIKKEWCFNLMPIVHELSHEELIYGKKKGGYCMYLLKLK
jgi:hypothetical protein